MPNGTWSTSMDRKRHIVFGLGLIFHPVRSCGSIYSSNTSNGKVAFRKIGIKISNLARLEKRKKKDNIVYKRLRLYLIPLYAPLILVMMDNESSTNDNL